MVVARGDGVVRPAGRGVEGGLSPWHDGQGGSRDRGEVPTLGVRLCWRQAARLRRRAQAWRTKESYKSSGPGHSEALTRSKCVLSQLWEEISVQMDRNALLLGISEMRLLINGKFWWNKR